MAQLRRPSGSIVGRSHDVRAVRAELERSRLVDLLGPGGVGKTALAAELINELEPDFDRVVLVELAEIGEGRLVRALAAALLDESVGDLARIIAVLAVTPTLLVIDNCEHVIDEVSAVVSAILEATDEVKVLATSRRPMNVADEVTWTVQPLAVPRRDQSNHDLTSTEAVQLFLERVRQSVPTFELTDANRATVAAICVAADGVPLVLELAAALVRGRPLDEILRAMTERPTGLIGRRRDRPEHQRSLAASLDWSRRFLTEADGLLLDRLAVFVGGFTFESARGVDPDGTADGLARLVDHSLVIFDPALERYRMLEVVRLDTEVRLDDNGREAAQRAHFEACEAIVARIEADRFEADPGNVFPRFECEVPNLIAALQRCRDRHDLDGFRALLGPIAVWLVHYAPPEDPEVWETAFADDGVSADWRANVISALSFFWSHRGHHDRSLRYAEGAVRLHRDAGSLIAWSLDEIAVGNARLALDDRAAARAAYQRGLTAAVASGHPYPELVVRVALARLDPDDHGALAHLTTARPLAEGFGAIEAAVVTELGLQALASGRLADARRLCDEALGLARHNAYAEVLASAICGRADVAMVDGDHTTANRLFGEALAIGRRAAHQGVIDRAAAGRARIPVDHGAHDHGHPAGPDVDLSERELSVARLLRGDLTQREIADELYIAPSTVKTHIKSIYRKLNVTKRSYAVTRATELGLFD